MPWRALVPDSGRMHHSACPGDPDLLNRLRTWAWERGRTDVVLDLDLHAGAWAFQQSPSRANLVRLAAVLPCGGLGAELEIQIRHLVGAGSDDLDARTLRQSLGTWSTQLCQRLADDLSEMATESAAGR
jgi:hypothetical protein